LDEAGDKGTARRGDRAHRIGQTRPVTVYRLISRGTVEEQIITLHASKRALVAAVLEGTSAAARLDTDELMELLRAGAKEAEVEDG
jgi:SNF2 family DNA or RNA helicase